MVIEVKLYDSLKRYAPTSYSGILAVDVRDNININELMDELEIEYTVIYDVKVNGESSNRQRSLIDGDRVEVFPG